MNWFQHVQLPGGRFILITVVWTQPTVKTTFPSHLLIKSLNALQENRITIFSTVILAITRFWANDREKITFTYPYGTFSYCRMLFGLCNAPVTFQRCMMAVFMYMVEVCMEIFTDNFSIYRDSFGTRLVNLKWVLQHCKDTQLVLNWEKWHLMVRRLSWRTRFHRKGLMWILYKLMSSPIFQQLRRLRQCEAF